MNRPDLTAQLASDLHTLHRAGKLASPWVEGMAFLECATPGAGLYRDGRGRLMALADVDTLPAGARPDLTDPLTVAGLIVLVREASGEAGATTVAVAVGDGLTWGVIPEPHEQPMAWDEPTEAAALCAALHLLAVPR